MSICEQVSDQMAAVSSGRSEWSPVERAHLDDCDECAGEWKLFGVATALGRDVAVDPARLTPALLARVRGAVRDDQRRRWVSRSVQVAGLAMAALLLLVLVPRRNGIAPVQPSPVVTGSGVSGLQLAELDDAAPAELEMVLAELDEPAVVESSLGGPDVEGLDQSQVERALRSWEES